MENLDAAQMQGDDLPRTFVVRVSNEGRDATSIKEAKLVFRNIATGDEANVKLHYKDQSEAYRTETVALPGAAVRRIEFEIAQGGGVGLPGARVTLHLTLTRGTAEPLLLSNRPPTV